MTSNTHSGTVRLVRWGMRLALLIGVTALPAAWLLSTRAVTVQFIVPADEAVITVNRFLYEEAPSHKSEDVIAIYGTASGSPERVLFLDPARILHPPEQPQLALLKKGADENPLQVQSVWLVARAATFVALAAFVLGWAGLWILRRRSSRRPRNAVMPA